MVVVFAQQAEANTFFVSFHEEQIRSESMQGRVPT